MTYTCIIIDDEPLSHEVIKNHLVSFPILKLAGSFFNARDAGQFLIGHPVDLLFLDIHMPEINGLDFLRSLENKPVSIVTTAYRNYAIEGFELGVIDYLLKPIYRERFDIAVKRAVDFLTLVKAGDTIDTADQGRPFDILIKTGTRKVLLDYRTISYAQGLKDYTILQTDEKKYVVKGSVKALVNFLPAHHFLRVHKSFIVAIAKIRVVHKNKIEFDNVAIPIGGRYRSAVEAVLSPKKVS